jgi:glycosyltransferase involved in cell wall biosynthesis
MRDQQELLGVPRPAQPSVARESIKLVVITEIISPYRIPVFNALARMERIDLHVIFLAETDPTQRQWAIHKDEIHFSYEVLPSWRRRFGPYHVLLNTEASLALRRARPQVMVCGGYNYLASWQSLWWARRHGVPFLLWVESTAEDRRNRHSLIEFLKTKFMRGCDAFIVAGKSSREYVRSFGAGTDVIFVAPDAVDSRFFAAQAEAARRNDAARRRALGLPSRFFLFAGRLVTEKGVFDLLQAYNALPSQLRTEIGLVFAGEGPARGELEHRAASFSPGVVQFTGFAQREELASYYGLAEIFVFPTHTDPWGLVVNEAMACGLPIICSSAAGCAADLVEDGWNGRVVSPGEPDVLASAMYELAQNGELRARMAEHSQERIEAHSPETCAAGIAGAAIQRSSTP